MLAVFFLHCGGDTALALDPSIATGSLPILKRVFPTSGKTGDVVTLFGSGFSADAGFNIVSIGGVTAGASAYGLVDPSTGGEVESLTVTLPTGLSLGAQTIFVIVFDNTSNTDTAFTVTP